MSSEAMQRSLAEHRDGNLRVESAADASVGMMACLDLEGLRRRCRSSAQGTPLGLRLELFVGGMTEDRSRDSAGTWDRRIRSCFPSL